MPDTMLTNSVVLITGGTGSLGTMLTCLLHDQHHPRKIIIFSRDEWKQHKMQAELGERIPELRFLLGDVRDAERVQEVMRHVDFVFHCAALKHVDRGEYSPIEFIKTNVNGSVNVVKACKDWNVQRAVLISSDKACQPVTHYGATKLCAEKLFLASNAYGHTRFSVVRYGNVLASRGSVIETYLQLRAQGIHEFPLTDERMTRFWITLPQAAQCVVATLLSDSRIGIPRIPSMKITDLARAIDPDCTFRTIGIRAGEKIHECLVAPEEHVPGFEQGYYSHTNELWLTPEQLRKELGI